MRIALVSQEYPPETAHGGIATQTWLKAHGLARRGHHVHVLSRSTTGERSDATDGGVTVTRLPGPDHRWPVATEVALWLSWSGTVAAELASIHAARPFDVVDFPEYGGEAYLHLLNQTDWNRLPTVVHLHGPLVMLAHTIGWPHQTSDLYRLGTAIEAEVVRRADLLISSSRCSAEWCARHYGTDASVPVVHLGVDTAQFAPDPGGRDATPTIAFAGRICASKGVATLVDAALVVADEVPRLRLLLAGRPDPDFLAGIEARVAASSHPDLLEVVGFTPREELPSVLARAHVFAAPSAYEGGPGLVYLEAMACGLPAIACDGSGAAEAVTHGETGWLVPRDDVGATADALRRVLLDPALADRMGRAARASVVSEASTDQCVARLEDLYQRVVERGGAR